MQYDDMWADICSAKTSAVSLVSLPISYALLDEMVKL